MSVKNLLLSLVLFAAAPASALAATVSNPYAGRLVKSPDSTAVYYVGVDQKRHAFPNQKVYFSWYHNFANVEVISDFELALYPLGGNVLYRPGSRLIKIPDVPEVYAVEPGGRLRNISSEDAAISLYGPDWAKQVDDIDISFFFDYDIDGVVDVVNDKAVFPRGTVVNFDGSSFIVDKRTDGILTLRPITEQAWLANQFDLIERHTITDPSIREFFDIGFPVTTAEPNYSCPACPQNAFERERVDQVNTAQSENQKYSLDLPVDWLILFPHDARTLLQAQPVDADRSSESFIIERAAAGEAGFASLSDFVQADKEQDPLLETWYEGPSLFLPDGIDLVQRTAEIGDAARLVHFKHFVQRGETLYVLHYAVPELQFSAVVDAIDLMMRTFTVQVAIPDTL